MAASRQRYTYLGGPDLAAIAGASRYQGPYDVFLRKVEQTETPDNAPMEWGRRLEGAVAQAYADRTGHALAVLNPDNAGSLMLAPQEEGKTWSIIHPEFAFIGGTPDFITTDDANLLLECKTAAEEQLRQVDDEGQPLWGPEGTDEVPLDYLVQCQVYMGLTGRRRADLAVFFLGARREFRIYNLKFDRELYDLLIYKGVAFWRNHVEAQVPPPMDLIPSDLVASHFARKAQASGATLDITPEMMAVALDLEEVGRNRKNLEDREDSLKWQILQAMATMGAQKVQGKAFGAKFSLAIQGGGEGKPVTDYRGIALALAKRQGLAGIPEDLEADFTRPGTPKTPYLMPYFTAVRNAMKKDAEPTQLSA